MAESPAAAQLMLDRVAMVAQSVGLLVNVGKTNVMASLVGPSPSLHVNGAALENVCSFRYLGSDIASTAGCEGEVGIRLGRAQAAYAMLQQCLWSRRDISVSTKLRVYAAVVRSTMLYACETWPLRHADLHRLVVFEHRCLRRILRLRWWDFVSNEVLYRRCHLDPLESIVAGSRWRWLGHVLPMHENRLPRRSFLAEPLADWNRHTGAQVVTLTRRIKTDAEKVLRFHMRVGWRRAWRQQLVMLAADRSGWRDVVTQLRVACGARLAGRVLA